MAVEWLLPLAKELYQNRRFAFTTWDKVLTRLLGPKSRVALVGPGGIGKTVLLDHITGRAKKNNYKLPGQSRRFEAGGTKSGGNRLALVVAPGQGGPKVDTFHEVFDRQDPVDGVVFVAGAGFVTLRTPEAIASRMRNGYDTIARLRTLEIGAELAYLRDVASNIRATKGKSRKPRWLLVAVTKIDLHYDEIAATRKYYSPHGDSEFAEILNELTAHVGSDNFEWDAVPVCSQLDDFVWGNEVIHSQLDSAARDHYLSQMVKRIGEMCQI